MDGGTINGDDWPIFETDAPAQLGGAVNPSQANRPATANAIQLAHTGIDVVPTFKSARNIARANCRTATIEKIDAARIE
ncbi:MAG: hypothetical protein JSS54_14120 [Proteobacteria bacterium]|nr:hypothetical protein [Pseudomonadota bacterium]MBS0270095.1 hypothetical protein [Pseudomonadota bacterium]